MDVLDYVFTALAVVAAFAFGVVALPIAGLVLGIRWIVRRVRGDRELPAGQQQYNYLEEDASADDVARTVRGFADDAVLGPYAQGILATFEQAERVRKGIFGVLEQEFERSSLTWEKFSAPVEVAFEGIARNATQMGNRMQAFDSKEYQRMGRIQRAGGYAPDSAQVRRLETMGGTLAELDDLQAANDRLIAELERLQARLASMAGSGYGTETDEIVEEIRRLAEDTQYYA